ncbi:MAG TPA: hypothetical protein VGE80_19570, partial [Schlesneria sp.]
MWIQRLHCRFAPAFLLAVVCGNQLTASAAEFDLEKLKRLDAVMQKYVEDKTVAGLTAAIGSREGIVATSALGYLNREQKLK